MATNLSIIKMYSRLRSDKGQLVKTTGPKKLVI